LITFSIRALKNIIKELFTSMVGLPLTDLDGAYNEQFLSVKKEISGLIGLSGDNPGIAAVHTTRALAGKITAAMLDVSAADLSDGEVNDGFGEIANIIAGNIKKELEKQKVDLKLSLPTVVTGMDYSTKILNGEKTDEIKIKLAMNCEGEKLFVEIVFQGDVKVE
jgi:chemotaxis protein CheX